MNRKVTYEACFEDYLRSAGVPYVAVDEAKKALFAGVQLKSFDFVVYSSSGPNLLVDVKGRRFGARRPRGGHLENWATRDDLGSLARWEEVFGSGFAGLLVFCYHCGGPEAAGRFEVVHLFRGEYYGLLGVCRNRYAESCRPRSAAWDTVSVPAAVFRELARPVAAFF
ncbi:MAG: hypothetical protein FJ288_15125 [Planctomycetes bacterium]|nr:hypothetical protein [Planctomycetota bacterium]